MKKKSLKKQNAQTTFLYFWLQGNPFLRGGSSKTKKGHLQTAPSWEMRGVLGRKLYLPQILQTSLRPDTVIWPEEANQLDSNDGPMDRWMHGRLREESYQT